MSQWAVYAILNLTEQNEQNQALIAQMEQKGLADSSALERMGLEIKQRDDKLILRSVRKKPSWAKRLTIVKSLKGYFSYKIFSLAQQPIFSVLVQVCWKCCVCSKTSCRMMLLPFFAVNKKSPVCFLCTWVNQLVKKNPSCQLVGIPLLLFSSVECHTCSINLL